MTRVRHRLLLVLALAATAAGALFAQPPANSGTILVSLIDRPIGKETFELRADGQGWLFTADLNLLERGGALQFSGTLQLGADLSPRRLTTKGRTYRFVNSDASVEIAGSTARVDQFGQTTTVPLPRTFFAALSYAPLASRALLIRYWEKHGRPASVTVVPGLPARTVRIQARGTDSVSVGGRDVRLRRFTVDGVVWGRETVWLDERDRFAAIVSRIHILPLEAVREDLKNSLPALQRVAIEDAVRDLAAMSAQAAPIADGSFALTGATVIDGVASAPLEDATILVRDGRIAAVGPAGTTQVPSGVRRIDARGKTIIPGLWDMHAHASQIEWAPAYLGAGVTTIRDMGGERAFLVAFRDALAAKRGPGPRMLLAGLVDGDAPDAFGNVVAGTAETARAVVDRYHADRFEQMKLYSLLQPPVVDAIVARAHEHGMTVTGHVPTALGIRRAVEAGMDHVAHMPVGGDPQSPATRETIDLLAAKRVVVDPTLPWGELLGRARETPVDQIEPGLKDGPPALVMNYRSVTNTGDAAAARSRVERQLATFKALHAAGVPIVAGTDGAVPGHSVLRALELSVQAGLTPMDALRTATVVPARAMGLDKDVGTIEPGKRADLVILDANPLADISNVRRIRFVVAQGRIYEPAELWKAAGWGR
jgi:imidazolonepropionase-like amidohydrolase